MCTKVAIVTGANKGIGFAIVQALCKQFTGDVYLTGRSEDRCKAAIADLQREGLTPKFYLLDLTDHCSITNFRDFLEKTYGGIDILVNNAGIAYKRESTVPFGERAEITSKTNFFGTLEVCNVLFPLLRPHARVVNVSSMASLKTILKCSDEVKARFISENLTMEELVELMHDYIESAKVGNHEQKGYPDSLSCYGMSKVAVTAMTFVQQRELNSKLDIVVNACCPGYVDTDMTQHKGTKTIQEGADTPVYLALLPPSTTSPKGNFLLDRNILHWG